MNNRQRRRAVRRERRLRELLMPNARWCDAAPPLAELPDPPAAPGWSAEDAAAPIEQLLASRRGRDETLVPMDTDGAKRRAFCRRRLYDPDAGDGIDLWTSIAVVLICEMKGYLAAGNGKWPRVIGMRLFVEYGLAVDTAGGVWSVVRRSGPGPRRPVGVRLAPRRARRPARHYGDRPGSLERNP